MHGNIEPSVIPVQPRHCEESMEHGQQKPRGE